VREVVIRQSAQPALKREDTSQAPQEGLNNPDHRLRLTRLRAIHLTLTSLLRLPPLRHLTSIDANRVPINLQLPSPRIVLKRLRQSNAAAVPSTPARGLTVSHQSPQTNKSLTPLKLHLAEISTVRPRALPLRTMV